MTKKRLALAVTVLVTLSFPFSHAFGKPSSRTIVPSETRQIWIDIQVSAVAAEKDADELRMAVARSEPNHESTLSRLLALKSEVNRMGKELSRLETERQSLPDWEQKAVDRTLPLLQAAAANTESAIKYYNDNSYHFWTPAGRGYVDRVYHDSKQIATTLHDYLRYEKLREEQQRLNQEVGATEAELGL